MPANTQVLSVMRMSKLAENQHICLSDYSCLTHANIHSTYVLTSARVFL